MSEWLIYLLCAAISVSILLNTALWRSRNEWRRSSRRDKRLTLEYADLLKREEPDSRDYRDQLVNLRNEHELCADMDYVRDSLGIQDEEDDA